MKKKFFIAAALLISINANAQDSTKTLNEIIVAANKFPNKASLTGKVVTIITREQIEKSGSKDLSQILTEQAGMFVNGANSNLGKDKSIYLRGAKVDYTLITVDGVPLYDPSGIGSNFDIRLLSIDNIERIEILKGSQSTLYGSDAMAGVINIITRKAGINESSIGGMFSYGNYNTRKGNINLSGSKKKLDYNINYSFVKTDGINEATDTLNTKTDKDQYAQYNLYESFTYKPTDKIKLQPYFRFAKFNQYYDQGAFTDELDLTSTNTNIQLGMKNEFKIGKAQLNVLYNYNNNDRIYIDDSTLSRNGYDIYSKGIYKGKEHFADAYIFYPINKQFKFTGGIDFRSSNSDQSYHSIGYFGPYNSDLGKDSLQQQQTGVYGALVVNMKSGFNSELGGRFNNHSAYGSNFVFNVNPSYLYKEKWKLFANVSSAYKTPTLYQLYSEYGNKNLKPESAVTFEGGVQYFSKNNKYNGRMVVYNRKAKDAIAFFFDPNTYASFYINQDKQNDYGLELESSLRIGKSTSIKCNYAFVDGKINTKLDGKDTSYFNLIRRPKSTFSLQATHKINQRFFASAGILYVGKRTDITYDAFYNTIEISLKDYVLLNLYAEYSIPKSQCKLFVDIKNLTNTKYSEVYGFNTLGINTSAGIRCSF
jgi:vitamin B12 transporter